LFSVNERRENLGRFEKPLATLSQRCAVGGKRLWRPCG
jgi:hypothetical protein